MRELPRLVPVVNCVKIRENYREKGRLHWVIFDPRKGDGYITLAREKLPKGSRLVSRLYYNNEDKVILTEMF